MRRTMTKSVPSRAIIQHDESVIRKQSLGTFLVKPSFLISTINSQTANKRRPTRLSLVCRPVQPGPVSRDTGPPETDTMITANIKMLTRQLFMQGHMAQAPTPKRRVLHLPVA
ncbi:hypothetical protein MN608_08786 [Microdochium nivale]|nr:hypothetical protein MN608_08786 [Microdochium nivale]